MQPIPPSYPGYAAQPNNVYMQQPSSSPSSQQYVPQHMQASPQPQSQQPPIPPRKSSLSSSSPVPAPGARTRPPEVPSSFPSLDALSIAQLEALLSGSAEDQSQAVKDLAADMSEVKQIEEVQRQLCSRIEELAKSNLARRDELEMLSAKAQVEATRLRENQQQYQSLLQRQQQAAQKYALGNILQLLDSSITSMEEQSEVTKSRYEAQNQKAGAVDQQDPVTLEQYIQERMVVHERAAKKERLVEMYGRQ
jgi:hypothetical protein